nr:MAG TPA: hypothetical protein [Caudoviricetes sp.]
MGIKKALQKIVSIIRRSSVMIDHRVSHYKDAKKILYDIYTI